MFLTSSGVLTDVASFEVHMPGSFVPTDTDSFMCSNFTFPIDPTKRFHIIAVEPLISNPFAHHIISVACIDEVEIPSNVDEFGGWECPSMAQVCSPSTSVCVENTFAHPTRQQRVGHREMAVCLRV